MKITVFGDSILKGIVLENGRYSINHDWERRLSDECGQALREMIELNYKKIYKADMIKRYEANTNNIVEGLFEAVYTRVCALLGKAEDKVNSYGALDMSSIDGPDRLDTRLIKYIQEKAYEPGTLPEQITVDYIAGMTDHYAVELYEDIYVPKSWRIK